MSDQNANKIVVQAQVEPTPDAAKTPQPASPTAVLDPESAVTLPSNTPDKTNPDTAGTRPDGATPNADGTLCPSTPTDPTAASTSAEPMESALTEQDIWELDDTILNLLHGEADDFDGANLDFAAALLEDDGVETAEHIAKAYNPEAETAPEGQDYPELELGVSSLELEGIVTPTWRKPYAGECLC